MTGLVVWLPACPATYVTPFTRQMIEWFTWLELWGKTPLELGLGRADEMDPRYWPAMRVLKSDFVRHERAEHERLKTERENT